MYLLRWRKVGVALMLVYVSEHKVSPYYRTAWRLFMKLCRDEVHMAPHMHYGVLVRSTQRRIQGRAKIGDGGLLQESASSDWKATAANQMYSNDLEACGMKCCYTPRNEVRGWGYWNQHVRLFVCLSVCPSVCPSVCLYVRPSARLSGAF